MNMHQKLLSVVLSYGEALILLQTDGMGAVLVRLCVYERARWCCCFVVLSMALAWFADTWWESGNCQVVRVLMNWTAERTRAGPTRSIFAAFSATLIIDVIARILLSQTDWALNVQKQMTFNDNMLYLQTWHMEIKIAVWNRPMRAHTAD